MGNYVLTHSGVKGMKWGVRRYQNKDGSLTPAGKKRYGGDIHDDYRKTHDKRRVETMSDAELRSRNNRLQMEKQYKDLTKKTNVGKKAVTAFIKTATTITAVTAAYGVYAKLGDQAVDKIGDWVIKGINLRGNWS